MVWCGMVLKSSIMSQAPVAVVTWPWALLTIIKYFLFL